MEQDDAEHNPAASTVSEESSSQNGDSNSGAESGGENEDGGSSDMLDYQLDPDKRREARKLRRVMANRRSARESRERRKKLLTDLQDSVESLTAENASLTKENLNLRKELASLLQQSGLAGSNAAGNLSNLALQLQPPQPVLSGSQGAEAEGAGSNGDDGLNKPKNH